MLGDQVNGIALPLVGVITLHASPTQMGVLTALVWLPYLFFALHTGAFADRSGHRRRLMIGCDLARMVLLVSIPVASVLGLLSMGQLYVVAFAAGTFSLLFDVSDSSLFVALVDRSKFLAANSLIHGSRAFSFVAGPWLGGVLVQLVSAPAALLVDAISYLGSAVLLRSIDPVEPPAEPRQPGQLMAGVRFIRTHSVLAFALASTTTVNFFTFVFYAIFLLYASRELGLGSGTIGLVLGMAAAGGLIGSAVTARVSRRIGIGPAFVVGSALYPAPLMLVPLAHGHGRGLVLALLFGAEFLSSVGVMMLDIASGTINAAMVPARLRARVAGAYTVTNYGVRPLGALVGGLMGSHFGLVPTLWVATVGGSLSVLWLLPSPLMRLRELPAPAE